MGATLADLHVYQQQLCWCDIPGDFRAALAGLFRHRSAQSTVNRSSLELVARPAPLLVDKRYSIPSGVAIPFAFHFTRQVLERLVTRAVGSVASLYSPVMTKHVLRSGRALQDGRYLPTLARGLTVSISPLIVHLAAPVLLWVNSLLIS